MRFTFPRSTGMSRHHFPLRRPLLRLTHVVAPVVAVLVLFALTAAVVVYHRSKSWPSFLLRGSDRRQLSVLEPAPLLPRRNVKEQRRRRSQHRAIIDFDDGDDHHPHPPRRRKRHQRRGGMDEVEQEGSNNVDDAANGRRIITSSANKTGDGDMKRSSLSSLSDYSLNPHADPSLATIFVSVISYRDAWQCSLTLIDLFDRALRPNRVYVGLVEQVLMPNSLSEETLPQLADHLPSSSATGNGFEDDAAAATVSSPVDGGRPRADRRDGAGERKAVVPSRQRRRLIPSLNDATCFDLPRCLRWSGETEKAASTAYHHHHRKAGKELVGDDEGSTQKAAQMVVDKNDDDAVAGISDREANSRQAAVIDCSAIMPDPRYYARQRLFGPAIDTILCPHRQRIRRVQMSALAAKGPAHARYLASRLYQHQDFYLVVDSHTRFRPHWDAASIKWWRTLRWGANRVARPVLTHYPIGFTEACGNEGLDHAAMAERTRRGLDRTVYDALSQFRWSRNDRLLFAVVPKKAFRADGDGGGERDADRVEARAARERVENGPGALFSSDVLGVMAVDPEVDDGLDGGTDAEYRCRRHILEQGRKRNAADGADAQFEQLSYDVAQEPIVGAGADYLPASNARSSTVEYAVRIRKQLEQVRVELDGARKEATTGFLCGVRFSESSPSATAASSPLLLLPSLFSVEVFSSKKEGSGKKEVVDSNDSAADAMSFTGAVEAVDAFAKSPHRRPPPSSSSSYPFPTVPLAAGGFLFAHAPTFLQIAPYDAEGVDYLFTGEEILMSARLFTHGFQCYSPPWNIVFHLYPGASANGEPSSCGGEREDLFQDARGWGVPQLKSIRRVMSWLGLDRRGATRKNEREEDNTAVSHLTESLDDDVAGGSNDEAHEAARGGRGLPPSSRFGREFSVSQFWRAVGVDARRRQVTRSLCKR